MDIKDVLVHALHFIVLVAYSSLHTSPLNLQLHPLCTQGRSFLAMFKASHLLSLYALLLAAGTASSLPMQHNSAAMRVSCRHTLSAHQSLTYFPTKGRTWHSLARGSRGTQRLEARSFIPPSRFQNCRKDPGRYFQKAPRIRWS